MNKTLWYEKMAAADVAALLNPEQIRDYLELRHPIGRKLHKLKRIDE